MLGGGFGGLYTAIKLENLLWQGGNKPKVTLIDQGDRFVFKPLLYELLNGTASATEVAPLFSQVLAPYPIQFLQAKVQAVEPSGDGEEGSATNTGGVVRLADGGVVEYDWLVLALGSSVNTFGIPGVKELAMPFVTYEDAMRVLARVQALESAMEYPELVVVGGGYSGVELATVLAERLQGHGRIKLVTNEASVLARSPPGQRAAALAVLQERGVSVVTDARVTGIERAGGDAAAGSGEPDLAKRLVLLDMGAKGAQGEVLDADAVLWTAGLGPASRQGSVALPFPANSRGQTEVDETLQVLGNERVFALGDIAVGSAPSASGREAQEQQTFPATAQVAFQQADYVAWNLWCAINARPRLPFRYQHLGEVMSLGRLSAAASLPLELPRELASSITSSPLGPLLATAGIKLGSSSSGGAPADGKVTLEGPLAQAARRLIYLYRQPTVEQQVRVGQEWIEESAKTALELAGKVLSSEAPKR